MFSYFRYNGKFVIDSKVEENSCGLFNPYENYMILAQSNGWYIFWRNKTNKFWVPNDIIQCRLLENGDVF